jgi:hypothetical protein
LAAIAIVICSAILSRCQGETVAHF